MKLPTFHACTKLKHSGVLLLIILSLSYTSFGQETKEIEGRQLSGGETVERELGAAQEHIYKVTLAAGQYVHVTVEQLGINATIAIVDPNNVEVAARDWWWREGRESVWVAAQTTGNHLLKISAPS